MLLQRSISSLFAIVTLSACGSAAQQQTASTTPTSVAQAQPRRSETAEAPSQGACSTTGAVHFDYDSSDIPQAERAKLASTAECLLRSSDARVRVTGMTDPRGTEEYNLALGERRAQASVRYMSSLGVAQDRLTAHSVGEEYAHDEDSSWAEDRRAEIVQQ